MRVDQAVSADGMMYLHFLIFLKGLESSALQ